MDASTSISQMLSGNKIFVPAYQRAYAWDIEQVSQFVVDLQDYISSHSNSKYYFGHFLFEDKGNRNYAIIDGQQRLTTITIFISAIYSRINKEFKTTKRGRTFHLWRNDQGWSDLPFLDS